MIVASYSYWLGKSTSIIPCEDNTSINGEGGNLQNPTTRNLPVTITNRGATSNTTTTTIATGDNKKQQKESSSFNFLSTSWEESTIIVTICFGTATQTQLLERLLYSLHFNGQWSKEKGRVVVLTDHAEHYTAQREHYHQQLNVKYPNLSIIAAKQEDLYPVNRNNVSQPLEFITDAMRYKRFKTLILDYLEDHYYMTSIYEHVLYLDVEIVIARPIHGLLQDYLDSMIENNVFVDVKSNGRVNTTLTKNPSFMSFFTDCSKCARSNFNLNGGTFLLHTQYSKSCLSRWKDLFDAGATYAKYDQRYLQVMKQERSKQTKQWHLCKFYQLPTHHRIYPSKQNMLNKKSTTVIHNTNTYMAKKIPIDIQNSYFTYLLNTTEFNSEQKELF